MNQNNQKLSTREEIIYVLIGISIAFIYTNLLFILVDNFDNTESMFILPNAHAQIEQRELQLREVRDLQDCSRKYVSDASAYTPFTLKVWYDTTDIFGGDIVQQGRSFPVLQQTPQVLTFHTNYTDQYQINFEIEYDEPRTRQVFIQYLSQGRQVQTEQEHYTGTKYCTQFIVQTSEAPQIPTREEMFGDAYKFFGMIPVLIDGFNQNSVTISTSITYMWLIIAGMIGLFLFIIIQISQDKKKFKTATANMNEFTENANEVLDNFDKKMSDFEKVTEGVMKNQRSILNFQEREAKSLETIEELKSAVKDQRMKGEAVSKPVRKFTSKVLHFKDKIKKEREEKESKKKDEEQKKKINVTHDDVDLKQETKRFKPEDVKERMPNDIMRIINNVNLKTQDADFDEFSYEQLNECYYWVTEKIKENNKKLQQLTEPVDITRMQEKLDKMATIQMAIHKGARQKWDEQYGDVKE